MKKILLCLALVSALFLVGCNDNKNPNNVDNLNNNNNNNSVVEQTKDQDTNKNEEKEEDNSPIVKYDSPDFSEKAGFKVNLGSSLEGVTYDSIFLVNKTTAQLDLIFPDKTIGTLLVEPRGTSHLYEKDDTIQVGDVEVAMKVGADGISVYEWTKDEQTYVYSTTLNLKESDLLTKLVNDVSIEVTDEETFRY